VAIIREFVSADVPQHVPVNGERRLRNFFNGGILAVGVRQRRRSSRRLHSRAPQDLKESAKLLIEDELQEFGDLQGRR
jgi:hypothetical protein